MKTLYAWVKDVVGNISDSLSADVEISSPNAAPIAEAGGNQVAYIGNTVTLYGSASSDPDGDPLTYRWSLAAKPDGSAAALSGPATVSPSFVVDVAGEYIVELVVNDGTVDSPPDTVTVSIGNNAPIAYAGPDVKVYIVDNTLVELDGSGSLDADGDPLTYQWALVTLPDGSQASLSDPAAVNPAFVVDVPGTYVAELVVNDGRADSQPDTVTVSTENTAPVAVAGPGQTVDVGDTVNLDGSGSSDLDGDPLSYQWAFLSMPSGSTAALSWETSDTPSFTADVAGNYIVELIVNDGKVDSEPSTVLISTQNSSPVAAAGPDQEQPPGSQITLDARGSSDPDGDPLAFQWTFTSVPDGSSASFSDPADERPTFTADAAGEYIIQLTVNDGKEGIAADTLVVTVASEGGSTPPTEPPPVVEPNPDGDGGAEEEDDDRSDRRDRRKKKNNRHHHRDRNDDRNRDYDRQRDHDRDRDGDRERERD